MVYTCSASKTKQPWNPVNLVPRLANPLASSPGNCLQVSRMCWALMWNPLVKNKRLHQSKLTAGGDDHAQHAPLLPSHRVMHFVEATATPCQSPGILPSQLSSSVSDVLGINAESPREEQEIAPVQTDCWWWWSCSSMPPFYPHTEQCVLLRQLQWGFFVESLQQISATCSQTMHS
jgi:hypothetical protein